MTGARAVEAAAYSFSAVGWLRDKKPSDCLNPRCLDRHLREPIHHEALHPFILGSHRAALERLASNHALLELIDQCWQIGYKAGCSPCDER
jgi:hypothetical protein